MNDKLFNDWAKAHKYNTKVEDGVYTNTHTQSAWEAWQASKSKPLSDEEICNLWTESQDDVKGTSLGNTTQEHYFARLIEERHGIK